LASGRIPRPTVDVRLEVDQGPWLTKALIDTGAPRCVFDRGTADALGLDLTDKTRARTHYLVGREWIAVPRVVNVTLPQVVGISWEAEVDFILADWDMPFGLLGQEGFLDRWVVTFNRYSNYFVVQSVSDFEERLPVDPWEAFQREFDGWDRP
jgi:hypothetical protein